jgi:hypothetical protein
MGVPGAGIYPRRYSFALLPRAPFLSEPPLLGLIDTAQWISPEPVRPLVRVDVAPDEFPFLHAVGPYSEREPIFFT